MYSVLVLWAPDSMENHRIVTMVARAFEEAKITPLVKKAAEATIVDVNRSEIVVFGTQKSGAVEVPADYAEFLRIFKGITLAGRTAGFFSMGPEKSTAKLRRAVKDTEAAQLDDDPLFTDSRDGIAAEIGDWVKKLISAHQELKYVGS